MFTSIKESANVDYSDGKIFEKIFALEQYLLEAPNLESDPSSQNAAVFLRKWVADAILPSEAFAERPLYSTGSHS